MNATEKVVAGRYRYPDTRDILTTAVRTAAHRELMVNEKQLITMHGPDKTYYRVIIERLERWSP